MGRRRRRRGYAPGDSYAKRLGRKLKHIERTTEPIPPFVVNRIKWREELRKEAEFRSDYHDLRLRGLSESKGVL